MSSSWAMPGASAPQPSRPVDVDDTPSSAAASGPSAGAAPLPPPPVPLRPMTIPDLLDGSFDILKRRPRDVLILATVFVVPIQVLSAVLLRDVIGGGGFAGTGLGDTTSTLGFGESGELTGAGTLAATLVASMSSLALLTGAMTMLVHDWYAGVRRAPSVIVLATMRRAPALLVAVVVVHVLEVVGLVGLGIGAYIVMAFLQIVSPVVVAEHVGPFRALVRSTQLTGTRFWRSMGVPLLVGLLSTIVGFGFQLIPEVATLVVADDWNWLIRSAGSTLSELVVAPFTAGVAILYHLDLRSRSEGYDIQRRVQALIES